MKRILAIAVLLLFTSNASAALLAEFSWQIPIPVVAPAKYEISRFAVPGGPFAVWTTETSDLNGTFAAPQSIVDVFNICWATGNGGWTVIRSDVFDDVHKWQSPLTNKFGGLGLDAVIWNGFNGYGWSGQAYVPQKGIALLGYKLTGLERSVTPTSQTIRIFGEVVPEPATWVLVCVGVVALLSRRRSATHIPTRELRADFMSKAP